MCYKNYTQHSGCGHYGPLTTNPYTPCEPAFSALLASRGPSSPPLSPPAEFFTPSRSNTTSTKRSSSSKRFFSLTGALHRSSTTTSSTTSSTASSSRRAVSGPEATSASASTSASNPHNVPAHELAAAASACPTLRPRTLVSAPGSAGQVCAECARWLDAMRSMVAGYDKGRGIKGTPAFKEFLQERDECVRVAVELGFAVPTARQARGIMGGFGSGRRSPSEGWSGSDSDSEGFGRELAGWRG